MQGISIGDLAIIATLLGVVWRLSAKLTAIEASLDRKIHDHEDDCMGHDSARVRVARSAAAPHPPPSAPERPG